MKNHHRNTIVSVLGIATIMYFGAAFIIADFWLFTNIWDWQRKDRLFLLYLATFPVIGGGIAWANSKK